MDATLNLQTSTSIEKTLDIPYTSLIGSINYCTISTHPDISYAVNKCAQFTSNPNIIHWEAAKRIVCYLLHTREYGITYVEKKKKKASNSRRTYNEHLIPTF